MSEETEQKVREVLQDKIPHYNIDKGMHWTEQGEAHDCDYDWHFDGSKTKKFGLE